MISEMSTYNLIIEISEHKRTSEKRGGQISMRTPLYLKEPGMYCAIKYSGRNLF